MSVEHEAQEGRWLPAESLPEPFGILWERLWHERSNRGEWKWSALVSSWKDARAIDRMTDSRGHGDG